MNIHRNGGYNSKTSIVLLDSHITLHLSDNIFGSLCLDLAGNNIVGIEGLLWWSLS